MTSHAQQTRGRPLVVGLASVIGIVMLTQLFPSAFPLGQLVQGGVQGCAIGLLALGLVLTYRTTKVINFSYGAMGSFAAEVGVLAFQKYHAPWVLAIALAIAAGVGCGVVVERLLRRFVNAPRLIVTVATIGLLQVFVGLQFALPYLFKGPLIVTSLDTPFSSMHFTIGHSLFYGNDVLAVVVVPPILIAMSWFLLRTEAGTAVRALAENPERAMLLGIPIHRLSRLVWMLVGGLAAAVMMLNAPTNGLPVSPFLSTGGVFIPALAAAVVAKMESLPLAFFSGLALGVMQAIVFQNVHQAALGTVVFLGVVLAALLFQKWDVSRAEAASESLSLTPSARQLSPEVAALPEIVYGRYLLIGLIGVVALALPFMVSLSQLHTYSGYLLLGMAVLSIVVLSGWSGTVSLGQFAIVGVGAVVGGDLIVKANADLFVALAAGAASGALAALALALPALRVRALFLAVTSLVFASAMDQYFLNPSNYPEWIPNDIGRPVLLKRFPLHSERAMYFVCLALLVLTVIVVCNLRARRTGRVLIASRDNPRAAAAMSVAVTRTRICGMVISGIIAGTAGSAYAVLQNGVGQGSFDTQTSVLLFSMAVVGGLNSVSGALCGVAVTELLLTILSQLSSAAASLAPLATGSLLLFVVLVVPGGVGQALELLRDRIAARIAARHGLLLEVGAAAGSTTSTGQDADLDDDPSTTAESLSVVGDRRSALSCKSLTASYGPLQVLFGVDIDIAEGEIVALLGTNGAGKSTVFKAITGLLPDRAGEVALHGRSIGGNEAYEIAQLGLSMMPGGRGVFPTLTVAENLRLSTWQLRGERDRAGLAREEMLELFPILRDRLGQQAGNLSGGEQQQLSLAMAFVTKPRVLFIDELSLGLAPTIVGQLCDKVREIHAAGTTIVVVEQSVNVALVLAERAIFLEKGAVRFEGPTAELLNRPDILRSVFIGEQPEREPAVDDAPRSDRGVALSCTGLVKRYGGITAVDHVDIEIPPGKIIGLVGHNGAGKTTLFDLLSGFTTPDGGRVLLGGHDVTDMPAHVRASLGLGRSFQEALLYPSLSVVETIVVALDRHLASREPVAAALALPAALDAEASAYERAYELVDLLGLGGYATTPTGDLSTGTRRIVELACVLAQDPAVVLLDEPSAGVAQKETEALGPLLRRIQAETGCAICIIEHDMGLMTSLCDELIALELGSVVATGTPSEVLAHERVIESYLGTNDAAINRSGVSHGDALPEDPPPRPGARVAV